MTKIRIANLKSVTSLEFDMPRNGVFVLTGVNGSGKTTLLTCLQRIADRYAFQKHFRVGASNQFDNYSSASIEYEHNGQSVTYSYRRSRWSPSPRRNSNLLRQLGFTETIFISSSGERFYVQNEELNSRGISAASEFIRGGMRTIFETPKFDDLRKKKLDGRGRGNSRFNYGFLIPTGVVGGQHRYYTERNFSLGEILVLNVLFELEQAPNNALLLIDEVELALHPRVQVNFLRFLETIAANKNLTVILSTHSSSLIKAAKKLMYVEKDRVTGASNVEYDCYPAIALQSVAVIEEVQPDIVFFVEDNYGRNTLDQLLNYYFRVLHQGRQPIYKILPVGGWKQVVQFMQDSRIYLIPGNVSVYSFLDQDVNQHIQTIQANANRTAGQQNDLDLYRNNRQHIRYLPVTPELGIVNLLNNDPHNHFQPLQRLFNGVFDIGQIILDENRRGLNYAPNPRQAAKTRIDYYVEQIKNATNFDTRMVQSRLCEYFAQSYCPVSHPTLQAEFNPIFN